MSMIQLTLTLLLGVLLCSPVEGKKCYSCNSIQTPSCIDRGRGQDTCEGDYCLTVTTNAAGLKSVSRYCGSYPAPYDGCQTEENGPISITSCICQYENCNSSTRLTSSVYALFVITATMWLVRKQLY